MTGNKINNKDRQDDVVDGAAIEPLLSVKQTADILNTSERQVWREIASGALEVVRLGPKMVRVLPSVLRRYIAQRQA